MRCTLSRTPSTTSYATTVVTTSEGDVTGFNFRDGLAKRSRRRFTHAQLALLENLFSQKNHPTRAQREEVAQAGEMDLKSVTVWFQNRRQTERKANHIPPNAQPTPVRSASLPLSQKRLRASEPSASASAFTAFSSSLQRSNSFTTSEPNWNGNDRANLARKMPRPSLDRVASRSEFRMPPPRTPPRFKNTSTRNMDGVRAMGAHGSGNAGSSLALWELMDSSPLAPNNSPLARDLLDFGRRNTLEWACAKQRLSGMDRIEAESEGFGEYGYNGSGLANIDDDGEETEEEVIEAVTPNGSMSSVDNWKPASRAKGKAPMPSSSSPLPAISKAASTEDEDTMDVALVLCGMGALRR